MPGAITQLANPARFEAVTRPLVPALGLAAFGLLAVGTYLAFFGSPPDHRQGEAVRIMYVHVPAAWAAMQTYAIVAVSALVGFVWRHRLADVAAREALPMGLAFTVLALATGSIWGRVTWGVWWDWDPRLTSMLVLAFLYAGLIAVWQTMPEAQAARIAALLAMLGAVNLPIIKFSVDWWDSLHQKATVIRPDGPAMPAEMLWPLGLMALGYTALFGFVLLLRVRAALAARHAAPRPAPSRATLEPARAA